MASVCGVISGITHNFSSNELCDDVRQHTVSRPSERFIPLHKDGSDIVQCGVDSWGEGRTCGMWANNLTINCHDMFLQINNTVIIYVHSSPKDIICYNICIPSRKDVVIKSRFKITT